ncbi:uncharacterized protein N7496_009220 [Penicillium cataractarum]|uniref:Receptor L-domain domain-containing protein n=1 Tax=Penicillium cataractarum TaxID=2100454 RepID=A0A9W9UZQ1_9EURO|nr:uncharacterized protein N7496_009220 [Penicillium cataractarum]KAJ5363507.1 hypothetical protein N7496_009220 [Penicillium cataractarum]
MLIHLLAIFATLWQLVIADSNNCSNSVTISSQSDANNLANCDTVDGSVTIASSAGGTLTFNNVEEIKGSFTVEGVSGLTGLIMPDLDTIKGALTLDNLGSLTNLTMSALSDVASGITITGNSKLKTLSLANLEKVEGQLKLTGSFTSVSLPSLEEVQGETTTQGSKSMSCSALNTLQSQGVYRGSYSCVASGSNSSSLSPAAKAGIAVGVIVGVLLILFFLWYFLRGRRNRKNRNIPPMAWLSPSTVDSDEKQPSSHDNLTPLPSLKPPVPRKPVGPPAAQLDGRSIYEVPTTSTPVREYHELDAGPVLSSHQRPIHSEA